MTGSVDDAGKAYAQAQTRARQATPPACALCGASLSGAAADCPSCGCPVAALDLRAPSSPLPLRRMPLVPQFDRLLVLAALIAFVSLYLPWLPGLHGSVPGWKVPYAATDVPLDEIRYLEQVTRPESLFLLNFAGIAALLFCRTSRHAGIRDMVATVVLVAGGGYTLVYFAQQWGWCLRYGFVGPYAAFASLALLITAGVLRPKFMPWVPQGKVLMLVASAFLLTAIFLPWSFDHSGAALMMVASGFYWLGVPPAFAYLMPVFPLLGCAAFVVALRPLPPRLARFWRCWAICFGIAAIVYFRAMWATYLLGWELGSWGVLLGLTILTAAGFLDALPDRPYFARFLMWAFLIVNAVVWLSFLCGDLHALASEFLSPPPRFF